MSASPPVLPLLLLPLATCCSFVLTMFLRRYLLRHAFLDVPNERSSHTVPTPRGGGLAIVATFMLGTLLLWWWGGEPPRSLLALIGAGALTAFVGWLDDRRGLAARWRLLAHFVAAVWVLFWLKGFPPLAGEPDRPWLWVANGIGVLYVVWLVNLFNFMDGIDGIAAVEVATVSVGAIGASAIVLPGAGQWLGPALLAACTLGFLAWNHPPARIFLGDSGSGFLGVSLAWLSLEAGWMATQLFWCWTILLGVFIVDATTTLVRRIARGKRLYVAHRSHAYQHASRVLGRHAPVTFGVAAINLLWLLPIALAVAAGLVAPVTGVLVAYAPLIALALRLKAGAEEAQRA